MGLRDGPSVRACGGSLAAAAGQVRDHDPNRKGTLDQQGHECAGGRGVADADIKEPADPPSVFL